MIRFTFNEEKATQAAAKLIELRGGKLDVLELLKLLYLLDREALLRWGRPVTGDEYFALKHGPILSRVYDLTKGKLKGSGYWNDHIKKTGERLTLTQDVPEDEFSDRESELIEEIARKYTGVGKWELRDFTHTLKEWSDPGTGRRPIYVEQILLAGNATWDEIKEIDDSTTDLFFLKRALKAC
jgi:uncharacterized phage-associated protein